MGLGEAGSHLPFRVLRRQERRVLGKADVRLRGQPQLAWEGWGSGMSPRHTGNPWSRGAEGPSVTGSFKPSSLLLEKRLSPALAWVPGRCGVLPRSRQTPETHSRCLGTAQSPARCANSRAGRRDAPVTPHRCGRGRHEAAPCQNRGACGSQNQGLNPSHPLRRLWGDLGPRGHGVAAPGRHAACALLRPAADRDWCVPGMVPRSPAWCRAPRPAHTADPGPGLSHLLGQSRDTARELLWAALTTGTATHF